MLPALVIIGFLATTPAHAAAPAADDQFEMIVQRLENEVEADLRAAPAVPSLFEQGWQSMEQDDSGGPLAVAF